MQTLIDGMRAVIGTPNFENGEMLEYGFAGIIACICIACVFRLVARAFS